MSKVRAICLHRRRRLRLRPLSMADLPALDWLGSRRTYRSYEPLAGRQRLVRLIDETPAAQVAIELDWRLVGAVCAAPISWSDQPPTQPWGRRERDRPVAGVHPDGAVLRGCGALWADTLTPTEQARVLTVGRKAVVQQMGLEATASVVEAAEWARWQAQMKPKAYLQQVHAGSLDDPGVSLWLDCGWQMRGFWEVDGKLEVVMWWGNRPR